MKAELLIEAAALSPAAAGTAAVVVTGGLLMAKKGILAAAALLLIVGAGWIAYRGEGEGAVPPDRGTSVLYSDTFPAPPPPPLPPPPPPPENLPPPVDLEACDRDLDLFGTTVDDEGKPVPGARVAAIRFPWARSGLQPAGAGTIEEEGPATVSASDGTFVFHLSRGEQWDLRATAVGYGQGYLDHCQAGEKVTLVLLRGGACVSVRCIDEQRAPVAGVAIQLVKKNSDTAIYGRTSFTLRGVTDGDGRLSFPHLAPGAAFLKASHEILGIPEWKMLQIPPHGDLPVELVMPTGCELRGRVTDASTGAPLPGARVGANWVMNRPVPTDADGRYRFPGWTWKDTRVMAAAADGYASMILVAPKEGDVDFALEPAFVATGRVVDAAGVPVEGALVAASGHWREVGRGGDDSCIATTEGGGGFVLKDLSYRASHDLSAEAPGHGRVSLTFEAPPRGTAVHELGDIPLAVCRTIEGRALGPDDEPLAGRQVYLAGLRPQWNGQGDRFDAQAFLQGSGETRRTDDLGRFRFPGLAPGRWTLRLTEKGAPHVDADVDLPADRDVLDALLRRTGRSITFLVTDAAGNPLPGITVSSDHVFPHSEVRDATMSLADVTDEEGRARFLGIPDMALRHRGTTGIRFRVQPYNEPTAPPWATVQTEPLMPAGQEVTVVLRPSSAIAGRVLDPDGRPVPGLYVTAVEADGTRIPGSLGICDAEGRFSLAVTAGTVVTLRIPGHGDDRRPDGTGKSFQTPFRGELPGVAAPAEGVEFRAVRVLDDQSLSLLVLDADGRPVAGYRLDAFGKAVKTAGGTLSGSTNAEGRLRWEGLMGDTLTVSPFPGVPEGTPEEVVPPPRTEVVPAGQEVVLRFRRGVPLDGLVLLPDGTPARGAVLHFNLMGGGAASARQPRTDDAGRFRLWFGEEQVVRIGAAWKDEAGTWYQGESADVRPGQGEVEVRIQPREK